MQGLLAALLLLSLGSLEQNLLPLEYRAFQLTQADRHDHLINQAAYQEGIDPFLLKGLIWEECKFDCSLTNKQGSGAAGCGQFTKEGIKGLNYIRRLRGNKQVFTRAQAFMPKTGIPAAAELLAYQVRRWGITKGIENYNGNKWKKFFAQRVLRNTNRYRSLSGLPPLQLRPQRKRTPLPVS